MIFPEAVPFAAYLQCLSLTLQVNFCPCPPGVVFIMHVLVCLVPSLLPQDCPFSLTLYSLCRLHCTTCCSLSLSSQMLSSATESL